MLEIEVVHKCYSALSINMIALKQQKEWVQIMFHKRIFIHVALHTCLIVEVSESRDLLLKQLDRNMTNIQ